MHLEDLEDLIIVENLEILEDVVVREDLAVLGDLVILVPCDLLLPRTHYYDFLLSKTYTDTVHPPEYYSPNPSILPNPQFAVFCLDKYSLARPEPT